MIQLFFSDGFEYILHLTDFFEMYNIPVIAYKLLVRLYFLKANCVKAQIRFKLFLCHQKLQHKLANFCDIRYQ